MAAASVQVTVPPGIRGGDQITVAVPPDNHHVQVVVPDGLGPGDSFIVSQPNQPPVVLGRPVGQGPGPPVSNPSFSADAQSPQRSPNNGMYPGTYPAQSNPYGGPLQGGWVGPTTVVVEADDKEVLIIRYSATVKCISIIDLILCILMALTYSLWFAIIAPLTLCGFWGAKTLKPNWLAGYQIFLILEIFLRALGGLTMERKMSIWSLLVIAVNVYILYVVHRLRVAILGLSPEQVQECRNLRDFQGFALY